MYLDIFINDYGPFFKRTKQISIYCPLSSSKKDVKCILN